MAFVYNYNGETEYNDGFTTNGFQPQNFAYGGRITFTAGGTINQLGLWGRTSSGTPTMKIAIYDTSGNLVADGGSTTISGGTAQWYEPSTFTATSVSATDYFILYSSSGEFAEWGWDDANDGSFATEGHATFPAATETITAEGDSGKGYGGRANFTASAGGRIMASLVYTGGLAGAGGLAGRGGGLAA